MVATTRIGVLVAQLGTPDAPTAPALRRYLAQFLSDMRVIDLNPLLWQTLLRGVILNTRPRRSAKLYRRIWTEAGSPLLLYTQAQARGIQERLGDRFVVRYGMRYGSHSIDEAIAAFEAEGIDRILTLPMYPQFSSSTTGSIYDAVVTAANGRRCPLFHERKRSMPTLRFVPPHYDDPGYIAAQAALVQLERAAMSAPPDLIIFSFHGIPKRYIEEGDPYRSHCEATAHALAAALELRDDEWMITFQSQFGSEEWLQPYTDEVLESLGERGVNNLLICTPGFTADCLETLDEIGNEGHEQFSGSGEYRAAPCLNADPAWLDALAALVRREAYGWVNNDERDKTGARHDADAPLLAGADAGADNRQRGTGWAAGD